jgi:hypothetical protein
VHLIYCKRRLPLKEASYSFTLSLDLGVALLNYGKPGSKLIWNYRKMIRVLGHNKINLRKEAQFIGSYTSGINKIRSKTK